MNKQNILPMLQIAMTIAIIIIGAMIVFVYLPELQEAKELYEKCDCEEICQMKRYGINTESSPPLIQGLPSK